MVKRRQARQRLEQRSKVQGPGLSPAQSHPEPLHKAPSSAALSRDRGENVYAGASGTVIDICLVIMLSEKDGLEGGEGDLNPKERKNK